MKAERYNTLNDKQIIELLIKNDEELIRFLFYDKCKPMFKYIIKEVFSYQVEEDALISELYLYLREKDWKKVREFSFRCKFTTWLSIVSVRFFIKRKSEMIDFSDNETLLEEIQTVKTTLPYESLTAKIDLYSALNKMRSSRDKFIIISLEIEGRSVEEVASLLHVTVANLYNIRKRAKKHLYELLKDRKYAN